MPKPVTLILEVFIIRREICWRHSSGLSRPVIKMLKVDWGAKWAAVRNVGLPTTHRWTNIYYEWLTKSTEMSIKIDKSHSHHSLLNLCMLFSTKVSEKLTKLGEVFWFLKHHLIFPCFLKKRGYEDCPSECLTNVKNCSDEVRTFWEAHKNLRNLPRALYIIQEEDFFQILCASQKVRTLFDI